MADGTCYVNIWDTGTSHLVLKDSLSTKIEWKNIWNSARKKNPELVFRWKKALWIKTIVKLLIVFVITKQKPNKSWLWKDVSVATALTVNSQSEWCGLDF